VCSISHCVLPLGHLAVADLSFVVSRTIDAVLDLSNHRVAVRKRTERKNVLEYTERRLILPTDAEIPGETLDSREAQKPPETAGVHSPP